MRQWFGNSSLLASTGIDLGPAPSRNRRNPLPARDSRPLKQMIFKGPLSPPRNPWETGFRGGGEPGRVPLMFPNKNLCRGQPRNHVELDVYDP